MPVQYKINVLAALKEKRHTTSRIRKDIMIGEATVQRLRHGQSVSYEVLDCQSGDILEYVPKDA